jgi:hypothetical protein
VRGIDWGVAGTGRGTTKAPERPSGRRHGWTKPPRIGASKQ